MADLEGDRDPLTPASAGPVEGTGTGGDQAADEPVDGTVLTDEAPSADAGSPPPSDPRPGLLRRLPKWPFRALVALALIGAFAVLILGSRRNVVGETTLDKESVVENQIPAPDGKALRQTQVGALLESGYDGRLTVNGIAIPEEQMEGAQDPDTLTPEQLEQFGVRPNNRDRVLFTPGPGQVIEEFDSGPVNIVLTYFPDGQPIDSGRSIAWVVYVD